MKDRLEKYKKDSDKAIKTIKKLAEKLSTEGVGIFNEIDMIEFNLDGEIDETTEEYYVEAEKLQNHKSFVEKRMKIFDKIIEELQ